MRELAMQSMCHGNNFKWNEPVCTISLSLCPLIINICKWDTRMFFWNWKCSKTNLVLTCQAPYTCVFQSTCVERSVREQVSEDLGQIQIYANMRWLIWFYFWLGHKVVGLFSYFLSIVLQTKARANNFPYSSQNHSINGILLNFFQDNAEKKPQGKQDSTNEVRFINLT